MQKITIAEVKPSTGEKSPTVITDTTGAKMSGFESGLKELGPGDIIEAELEVKGKYTNIKSFTLVQKSTSPAPTNGNGSRDASIEAQVAAKIGGGLMESGKIEKDDPLGQLTIAWCILKLEAVVKPAKPTESKKPEQPSPTGNGRGVPGVDLDDLKTKLHEIGWTDVLDYIKSVYKIEKPTVTDALLKMTLAQREGFIGQVNQRYEEKQANEIFN